MRPRSQSDFTVAIICALPLEADAVEALFDETYDRLGRFYGKQPGDKNSYMNGRIGQHNIVLCCMPGMGKGSAASVASSLQFSYTGVQIALVVGICGGTPHPSSGTHIFLGDVIISDSVVQYDFGRQYPGGFQRKTDVKDILGRPNKEIRTLLADLKASIDDFQDKLLQYLQSMQQAKPKWKYPGSTADILFKASHHHKHHIQGSSNTCRCFDGNLPEHICEAAIEESCTTLGCDMAQVSRRRDDPDVKVQPHLHVGKEASADIVMKSGEHRDKISTKEKVVGFEMEGAGV